ncbi:hypothetical protein G6027_08700 [Dietzia sp. SLG310A2-38A2]|uniref:hypothetical protein n=1 Tax=Dietzia sp. SLG310A2-38A2 TaxID=1630643 RepID=UPI0015FB2BD3|nr:hypothetical protein [Dietzia sp. SLG310A2-38A2]MBB1030966.1 hypothetical protein [Dietzia sp. SLG310A2-38A2]
MFVSTTTPSGPGASGQPGDKKERTDVSATAFGAIVGFLIVAVSVWQRIAAGGVPSSIAPLAGENAMAGGRTIDAAALSPAATWLLWGVFALDVVLISVVIGLVAVLSVQCLKGRFFTSGTIRLLTATSWVLLVYLVAPVIPRAIGTNMARDDLGLSDLEADGTEWEHFVLTYVLLMLISLITVAFRRAKAMREDQEGLV